MLDAMNKLQLKESFPQHKKVGSGNQESKFLLVIIIVSANGQMFQANLVLPKKIQKDYIKFCHRVL